MKHSKLRRKNILGIKTKYSYKIGCSLRLQPYSIK